MREGKRGRRKGKRDSVPAGQTWHTDEPEGATDPTEHATHPVLAVFDTYY